MDMNETAELHEKTALKASNEALEFLSSIGKWLHNVYTLTPESCPNFEMVPYQSCLFLDQY